MVSQNPKKLSFLSLDDFLIWDARGIARLLVKMK